MEELRQVVNKLDRQQVQFRAETKIALRKIERETKYLTARICFAIALTILIDNLLFILFR